MRKEAEDTFFSYVWPVQGVQAQFTVDTGYDEPMAGYETLMYCALSPRENGADAFTPRELRRLNRIERKLLRALSDAVYVGMIHMDALRQYYSKNSFRVATPESMRNCFLSASENPRAAQAIFQRWLKEKRGDEDIGAPDMTLIPPRVSKIRALGRVFVKIGKTAAKPF